METGLIGMFTTSNAVAVSTVKKMNNMMYNPISNKGKFANLSLLLETNLCLVNSDNLLVAIFSFLIF